MRNIIIVIDFYNFDEWRGYYTVVYNFCHHFGYYWLFLWLYSLTLESSLLYKNWNISWFEVGKYLGSLDCRISSVRNFENWPCISSIFLTGIKNINAVQNSSKIFYKFPTFLQSLEQIIQNLFYKTHLTYTFSQKFSKCF